MVMELSDPSDEGGIDEAKRTHWDGHIILISIHGTFHIHVSMYQHFKQLIGPSIPQG